MVLTQSITQPRSKIQDLPCVRLSRRRPCPPLYSGRAGYKLETLVMGKDFLALAGAPAVPARHYPKWVLSGIGTILAYVCPFAILSSPGLPCRSEQSRKPSSLLSVASRGRHVPGCSRHVPARARHAPGTRPGLPRRLWHTPPGIPRMALCRWSSSVATCVGMAPWAYPGVNPLLLRH